MSVSARKSKSMNNLKSEILDLDLTSTTLDEYKTHSKTDALHLVKDIFPNKVLTLNALLDSDLLKLSRLSTIPEVLNIPIPEPAKTKAGQNEVYGKKRSFDELNDGDHDVKGCKVFAFPNGTVPLNSHIVETVDVVKPLIRELIDHANQIKMWIVYMIPRMEDGNNFGVAIQEDTLGEVRQVEADAASYLDQIFKYFVSRGSLIAKIAKYPHVSDFRRCLTETDEKQFVSMRLVVCELRNHYASLHDVIVKNLEKLTKPRTSNTDSMF